MKKEALIQLFNKLRSLAAETEVVEFKEAKNGYDSNDMGEYFSALSNEANLKQVASAWLIFGVKDKGHTVVGSNYRLDRKKLDHLKEEIANKTTNRITFIEIYELDDPEGRIILFQIPAAPKGLPIAWEGHYYGRDGEAFVPLNLEEIERIRSQATAEDWSAAICPDASLEDLDPLAIAKARENFKNKFPQKAVEVDGWNDLTFLNKAKLTLKGKITRAAIMLLGREEAEHFISPAVAKIRRLLKDSRGNDKDYQIETCPLLLAVDKIYSKIRNLKYRYLKEGTLFPDEVDQYEPFVIREAINNCIAHQDYAMAGVINVVEMEDQLIFTNLGSFIPGSVEKVVEEDAPEEPYRNRFLATAMFNLKMADTAGGGIRKMFDFQRARYFPMPEYDLSNNRVKVTITGKVLDMDYARVLSQKKDLELSDITILDKVQKRKPLSDSEIERLRSRNLIEGRKPNFHISFSVAERTNLKAEYIKTRGLKDDYFKKLILEYLDKYKRASRDDIDHLLLDILPGVLDEKQKKNKIRNLVYAMSKKDKSIINQGSNRHPVWVLLDKL